MTGKCALAAQVSTPVTALAAHCAQGAVRGVTATHLSEDLAACVAVASL
jgi:hypothetical protein